MENIDHAAITACNVRRIATVCLLTMCLLLTATASTPNSELEATSGSTSVCQEDEFGRYPALEGCFRDGIKLFLDYFKKLQKKQNLDICRRFSITRQCIQGVVNACPTSSRRLRRHWEPIMRRMDCFCRSDSAECQEEFQCVQRELSGKLVQHCDQMHAFNLQQNTKGKCFFAQELTDCKVALIGSSCGASSGHLIYHVTSLMIEAQPSISNCHIHLHQHYNGFHFHADCPSYFPEDMATCVFEDLRSHFLPFHEENVLIANAKSKEMKEACVHYRQYRLCMRPKRKACPEGSDLLLDMDHELRVYLLKMEIICDKRNRKEYSANIDCYHDVLEQNLLHRCHLIWLETWPLLSTITAHKFYCDAQSKTSQRIMSHLSDLQKCYEDVFSEQCGPQSGTLLASLAQRAFQDPHFLRFSYKPNCALHSVEPIEEKTSVTTTPASHLEVPPSAGVEGENHDYSSETLSRCSSQTISTQTIVFLLFCISCFL